MKTFESTSQAKTSQLDLAENVQAPSLAQCKGYEARTSFPAGRVQNEPEGDGIVQLKRYVVSRDLPLETHYSLIEESSKPPKSKNEKTPKEKAQDSLLSKLREAYPISEEDEDKAVKENWSGLQRDIKRGEEFNKKKTDLVSKLDERQKFLGETEEQEKSFGIADKDKTATGYWVSGAHVKGLSVVNERERKNTPESGLIKKVTKMDDWIGAHLIKRDWGGEDNMWNVVCWPKDAEAAWGRGFEEPIDRAFTNRTIKKLDISVQVEKEDKTFSDEDIAEMVESKTKGKTVSTAWRDLIEQNAELAQMEANRAMESVPVRAKGSSKLGSSKLSKTDTNWTTAKSKALDKIKTVVDTSTKKEPHEMQIKKFKKNAVSDKRQEYGEERERALNQEKENYRSEIYTPNYDL